MSNMDQQQLAAVSAYERVRGRIFLPDLPVVEIPVDALVFSVYQQPWTTLTEYKLRRCIYDRETNEWLVEYVTDFFQRIDAPPIYVDILPEGVALVDGVHRVTSAFVNEQPTILAHLNEFSSI